MADRLDNKGRKLRKGEAQRANLTYMYRYTDINSKRQCIYNSDLSRLRMQEKLIARDIEDGINTLGGEITLNEQFVKYMNTKTKIALSTKMNILYMWEKDIKNSYIGDRIISKIKKSDILELYSGLSQKGYKNGTLMIYHNVLSPTLQLAVDDDLIRKNPCKNCMNDFMDNDATVREALSIKQQEKLLEFTKNNKYYKCYHEMLIIMIGTALRRGEIIGLTWDNIDMKNRIIKIDHQLLYKKIDGSTKFYISRPKSKSGMREIPFDDKVFGALKSLNGKRILSSFSVDGYSNFLFMTKYDSPIQPNMINRFLFHIVDTCNKETLAIKKNKDTVLLPNISAHTLRHTGCTRMAESGMDPRVLQDIMGHSDIGLTMKVYNHVDMVRKKKELTKMNCAI